MNSPRRKRNVPKKLRCYRNSYAGFGSRCLRWWESSCARRWSSGRARRGTASTQRGARAGFHPQRQSAIKIAQAGLARAEPAVKRARVETIPNLEFKGGLQQNSESLSVGKLDYRALPRLAWNCISSIVIRAMSKCRAPRWSVRATNCRV
jgi:hypothetical protein